MAALWTLVNGALKPRNVPAIVAYGRATAQVAANANVATYTVGAADGSFEVNANVNVTVATTHSFNVIANYTDETNTARTHPLVFILVGGSLVANPAIVNANGVNAYGGLAMQIRCKAGTTITLVTSGTFTTVTYNVEGVIKQVN